MLMPNMWTRIYCWVPFVYISLHFRRVQGKFIEKDSVSIPFPNNCGCYDDLGRIYNLKTLQNIDETASLKAESIKYHGYRYSYNPCSPFKLGPMDGNCQRDVAICWWTPPVSYQTIGMQGRARCHMNKATKKPSLVYKSRDFPHKSATVTLKCAENKKSKDDAEFEVLDEDNWIFQLTHLCACGNGCPTKSPNPHYAANSKKVIVPVVATVGPLTLMIVLWFVWRHLRRQNRNNDDGQNLIDEQYQNQFE